MESECRCVGVDKLLRDLDIEVLQVRVVAGVLPRIVTSCDST